MQKNQFSLGILILFVGIFILLGKLGIISFLGYQLWPIFVLIPGLALHMLYFSRVLPAPVLIPGGILTTYALLFFFCNIFGWSSMAFLWPVFIFGVAVGLYEFYLFSHPKERGVLTAAIILGIISAVFLGFTLLFTTGIYLVAGLLIAVGAWMVFSKPRY